MKKRILLILTIILGLGISLGAVYFMYYKKDERLSNLTTGLIKLNFQEKSNVIDLDNEIPVPDTVGVQKRPYIFTVKNISQKTINLNIKVDVKENTNIPLGAVRYGVFINDKLVKKDYIHDDKILYTYEELLVDETIECKLRFWIDYYYDLPEKEFEALIQIEGESRDTGTEGITVTFDANGGTVDTTTKEVVVGENYGRLPTPTREGYTFKGWNGKNLFNKDDIAEGYISDDTGNLIYYQSSNATNFINIKSNTNYLIRPILSIGNWGAFYDENKNYISGFVYTNGSPITSHINARYIRFTINCENSNVNWKNTTQLEEGIEATEYEPYYITNDTKVVQNQDHTLKAIWEQNNFTVTFDYNDGVTESTTKQVTYNSTYGDLPTPTREGYTFKGWNGKNLFNKDDVAEVYISNDTGNLIYHQSSNATNFINIKSDTNYLIRPILSIGNWGAFYDENKNYISGFSYINGSPITSPINARYIRFTINYENSNVNWKNTTQLEEGIEATEYEPYYITNDTKVVQNKDHTLKAIWEENS